MVHAQRPELSHAGTATWQNGNPKRKTNGVIRVGCSDLLGGIFCNFIFQNSCAPVDPVTNYQIPRERNNPEKYKAQKNNITAAKKLQLKQYVQALVQEVCIRCSLIILAVYDYSFTIGPESKSKVREFLDIGNFRSFDDDNYISRNNNNTLDPQFTSAKEREPLVDIITSNKKVKVVLEMPLVDKKDIKIKALLMSTIIAMWKYILILKMESIIV